MSSQHTEDTREGGREAAERPSPELSGSAAAQQNLAAARNSSGSASTAAAILDLRQYITLLCEIVLDLDRMNLIEGVKVEQLKRLRQRGYRRNRG